MKNKVDSFTLAELVVVMIITAIVMGMAFSVLRLVQKEVYKIQNNFEKKSALYLLENSMWRDFNEHSIASYDHEKSILKLKSEVDSVKYYFFDDYALRNNDTIKLKLEVDKVLINGQQTTGTVIDAISISAESDIKGYRIFVSKKNDLTSLMN